MGRCCERQSLLAWWSGACPPQAVASSALQILHRLAMHCHPAAPQLLQLRIPFLRWSVAGPRSSALVGGYTSWHRDLECALAQLKGTQDCLLFPTGFAANLAVASALCRGGNIVLLSDELNHASIVDGARLGRRDGAKLLVYRHNDLAHLEELLTSECPPGGRAQSIKAAGGAGLGAVQRALLSCTLKLLSDCAPLEHAYPGLPQAGLGHSARQQR